MSDDIERLKQRLWKQFNRACELAENQEGGSNESRAMNRQAAGTVGLAIIAAEREQRERDEQKKTFTLVGKEKSNGP